MNELQYTRSPQIQYPGSTTHMAKVACYTTLPAKNPLNLPETLNSAEWLGWFQKNAMIQLKPWEVKSEFTTKLFPQNYVPEITWGTLTI